MAKVGSAILKQGSCPRQWGGDLPSEGWAAGSALPIRCSLSRIGGGESSRPRLGIIPALAVEVTHSMAALRDSLNACAACTLPAVPLHWRYTWDAYHVGLAGQGGAGAQGAAGFSPRGPSDGATAGIHRAGGIGGLLAVEAPQAVGDPLRHWYFYDSNGNVGQLVSYDSTGPMVAAAPAAHYEYDLYGGLLTCTGSYATENPFRFSTKWLDRETTGGGSVSTSGGVYYYGLRYYSPGMGRWTTRDLIGELGGENLYGFLSNCPSGSCVDPLGLSLWNGCHLGSGNDWLARNLWQRFPGATQFIVDTAYVAKDRGLGVGDSAVEWATLGIGDSSDFASRWTTDPQERANSARTGEIIIGVASAPLLIR